MFCLCLVQLTTRFAALVQPILFLSPDFTLGSALSYKRNISALLSVIFITPFHIYVICGLSSLCSLSPLIHSQSFHCHHPRKPFRQRQLVSHSSELVDILPSHVTVVSDSTSTTSFLRPSLAHSHFQLTRPLAIRLQLFNFDYSLSNAQTPPPPDALLLIL